MADTNDQQPSVLPQAVESPNGNGNTSIQDSKKINDLIDLMPVKTEDKQLIRGAVNTVLHYAPPLGMRTRRILYVIGMILMLAVIFVVACWYFGMTIPKLALALTVTVFAAAVFIFLWIAHANNAGPATIA